MSHSRILALVLIGTLGSALAWAQAVQPQPQTGPVIIPKQAPAAPQAPAPEPEAPPKAQFNYSVNVPEVQIPVRVLTNKGQFIPGLGIRQFRLYENGVPQPLTKVSSTTDAPMTVVLLIEFRQTWWRFLYNILEASYDFTAQLQPHDWVALVTYDLKPTIVVDFTHNKNAIYAGLNSLHFANFSEGDLFDSLTDVINRLNGIQGQKTIVLISTGLNTFSHMTWGQMRKKLEGTQNVTIYTVAMGWALEEWLTGNGYQQQMTEMNLLQAENELRYIATTTGGLYYEPRFEGAYPDVFRTIGAAVRSEYILSYEPTDKKLDGTERKIKVELAAPNGKPLKIVDQHHKQVKYKLEYRPDYTAPHAVN